jgi:phage gp29-like protein
MMMQKYGMPMMVAKADAQQKDTVDFLQQAFALATQIGGLVVDKNAEVVMEQMNGTDGSNSHKIFNDYCNCEVSKLVVGQVLSSTPKNTGLGSGMADQAEGVRDDIRVFDTSALQDTLRRQSFQQFLEINGYRGRAPYIFWGGKKDGDAAMLSKTLAQLGQGGYELTDAGVGAVSDRLGYGIQRRKVPLPTNGKPVDEGGDNPDDKGPEGGQNGDT